MTGPLQGIRVVEFSQIIAGPISGVLLSDLGAEVIKIEPPWGDAWRQGTAPIDKTDSKGFIAVNRGKRSISIDAGSDDGRAIIQKLVASADVVTVNNRVDVLDALGIDYDTLKGVKPDLIYSEITAFGREGPYAGNPGYDLVMQGLTGIMSSEGIMDGYQVGDHRLNVGVPRYVTAMPMVDYATGYSVVQSVCAALFHRERTGQGQKIETSLFANALTIQGLGMTDVENAPSPSFDFVRNELPLLREAGLGHSEIDALYREARQRPYGAYVYYRSYATADLAITLGCLSEPLRKKAADALGVYDMRFDEGYVATSDEALQFARDLSYEVEKLILTKTQAEWLSIFDAAGVPAGPMLYVEEMVDHEQARATGMIIEQQHPVGGRVLAAGPLSKWSETPTEAVRISPARGEHTTEVLAEVGYSEAEIQQFYDSGAVHTS
jgi:formyl-CoA transferase